MSESTMIAIRPTPGRRLILPAGSASLDGVPLAEGSDMAPEGALVRPGVWASRVVMRGDAEPVPPPSPAPANRGRSPAPSTGDGA